VKEDCFKLKKKLEGANSSAEQAEVVLAGMWEEKKKWLLSMMMKMRR